MLFPWYGVLVMLPNLGVIEITFGVHVDPVHRCGDANIMLPSDKHSLQNKLESTCSVAMYVRQD